jgi:AsmA protein
MSKPLKIAAIAIAALIILVGAVLAVLVATFDPNDYKGQITEAVAKQTGRTLSIPGDLSLSVFPWIGVTTGKVVLSNAGGFGEAPFAEFDSAEVKVKLIPLLSRNIQVSTVNVSGLNLNLARNKQGVTNWDDLVQAGSEAPQSAPAEKQGQGGGPAIGSLTMDGVNIVNANLAWDDRLQDVRYAVSDLNVSTGPLSPGSPADIKLATSVSSSQPEAKGTIEVSTTVHLGDNMESGSLKNLKLVVDLTGSGLPGGKLKATVSGDAELDMKQKIATVSNLKADAYGVNLAGNARVLSFDTEPTADIALSLAEFNPKKVMEDLGLTSIQTNDPQALTSLAGSIDGRFTTKTAEIRTLDMQIDGTPLSGTATARDFTKPDLSFDLKAGSLDMDRYMPKKTKNRPKKRATKKRRRMRAS